MLSSFIEKMENNRQMENSAAMEAYMKGLFPFMGIKAPERKNCSKDFIKDLSAIEDFEPTIRKLWELPEREYQYVAVDFLVKVKKRLDVNHLDLLEFLITTKSWWDTVDAIASHLVGSVFLKAPAMINDRGEKWLESDDMWLKRTMILFQLKYKEKTDEELLFSIIKQTKSIDEFFIQKAIGWSLREYSKTNPQAVQQFIEKTELSNLAKREGLKHMKASSQPCN